MYTFTHGCETYKLIVSTDNIKKYANCDSVPLSSGHENLVKTDATTYNEQVSYHR